MCAFRIGCYIPLPCRRHQFPPWMLEMQPRTNADADRWEQAAEGRWLAGDFRKGFWESLCAPGALPGSMVAGGAGQSQLLILLPSPEVGP